MRERLGARLPWVVLGAALVLTVAATTFVWRLGQTVTDVRFANAVQGATDRITGRIEIYAAILRGGAAFLSASEDVTAADFREWANRLEVQQRFPGIQGIGWTRRISYDPEASPDERHAIMYLEPLDDRNRAAIGFDMYSEPTRRAAMAKARDSGNPALSGRVTLVQEIRGPRQAGLLLYVPVYGGSGVIPATVEERRRLLRGFVYAPFRADDLFTGIFGSEETPRVTFTVYDGASADSASLLHRSGARRDGGARRRLAQLEMAQRPWTVEFRSLPPLEREIVQNMFWVVLAGGLVMTGFIGWLTFAQARARAAAESANRAKSDFLAMMSHELRTPLNAIGGYVDLIDLGVHGPTTAEQRQALSRIRRAQNHLLGLINNVLNYARIEAGRVVFVREVLNLEELLDAVSDMIAPQAAARQLTFERIRGDASVTVYTDREKTQQVLLNLLSNAVKFTDPGGRVTLSSCTRGNVVCVSVTDTGIGIPRSKLESIFDPFVQVEAPLTRDTSGTGLGLAISRDLSRALGGDVRATSEPGRGSTFLLELPRAPEDVPAAPTPPAPLSSPESATTTP